MCIMLIALYLSLKLSEVKKWKTVDLVIVHTFNTFPKLLRTRENIPKYY